MPAARTTKKPLPNRVTEYVFKHIRDNALRPGDSLPSEVRTSTDLSISRSIVREAFRSLEVAGIIEKGNGRSPRVGAVSGDFLSQLMQHALLTHQLSPEQVLDVRTALEVRVAELAAVRRTAADIQQLRIALQGMRRTLTQPEEFVTHDLMFHDVLNRASDNVLVVILSEAIQDCARQTMHAGLLTRRKRSEILEIIATHARIADAVEARDARSAGASMKRHFAEARRAFRNSQKRVNL